MIKKRDLAKIDITGIVVYVIAIILSLIAIKGNTPLSYKVEMLSLMLIWIYELSCNKFFRRRIKEDIKE